MEFNNLTGTVGQDVSTAANFIKDNWLTNDGTATGAPHLEETGCVTGRCLSFDGSADYVVCGSGSSLNMTDSLTISAWIYPHKEASSVNANHIVGKMTTWRADGYDFRLGTGSANVLQFITGAIGDDANGTTVLQKNIWHNVVAVQNGTSYKKIYLNGIEDGSKVSPTVLIGTSVNFKIGVQPISVSELFDGWMDDVRIYNKAIPTSQIQSNYFAGINKLLKNNGIALNDFNQKITELKNNLTQN